MSDPLWQRSRFFRFTLYGLLALPLIGFHIYEGLILLALIGLVVEFACYPGKPTK